MGVPVALVRALDTGAAWPVAWRRPLRVVIFSTRGRGELVLLGDAPDGRVALQRIVEAYGVGGTPDLLAISPDISALASEIRSHELRKLCILIDNTLSVVWLDELAHSMYLGAIHEVFPDARLLVSRSRSTRRPWVAQNRESEHGTRAGLSAGVVMR